MAAKCVGLVPAVRDVTRRRRDGIMLQLFYSKLTRSKPKGWFCYRYSSVVLCLQGFALEVGKAPEEFKF